jgi:peptidyl-prolyl cis-trans isomerase SurA
MVVLRRLVVALLVLLPLPVLVPAQAAAQRTALVDRIVAVVNKEVITLSELNDAIASAERNLRRSHTQPPPRDVFERQMLERLILEKAQLQLARDSGVRVDDLQVDRAVERIAASNNMTLADFRRTLESDGVAFDAWRNDIRQQMILGRLREREVDNRVQVSESEVDTFLEQAKARPDNAEYNIAHILVRVPEGASPERIRQARERAEQALGEIKGGAPFARVAASYSDAPDALQGGAIGWRSQDRLPELFSDALAKMQPGQVSEPLRSPAGFHLLQLVGRRGAGIEAPVQQTRLRHILIRTNEAVSESEARRKLLDLRDRIVNGGADFGELARQYSDDGTAARGGELDWVYPGDTVPEFEHAYEALKIGEVSQPVRTPFGYHLIQVLERRSSDVSPERKRMQARQALRDRKADEAYQEWLRQLRDSTYVELRLDER